MNQDINFIYAERQRPTVSFNGRVIIKMILFSWLLMFASSSYIYSDLQKAKSALDQETLNLQEQQARTNKTEKLYPPTRSNPKLAKRLEALRAERETKTKLIQLLAANQTNTVTPGFHGLLEGIGKQQAEGLWFNEISIKHVGKHLDMRLTGGATDPSLVPQFIKQLSGNPLFVGSEFSVLGMQRNENDRRYVSFTLVTPKHEEDQIEKTTDNEEEKS